MAREIGGRNAPIGRLVSERKGDGHANLFLPDAIYMTYYTPMLAGIGNIRPYFVEHEQPGGVTIQSLELNAANIYPMADGKMLLEQGFYKVAWRAGGDGGTVTGKSLNLWKRDTAGTPMLYREAVNHGSWPRPAPPNSSAPGRGRSRRSCGTRRAELDRSAAPRSDRRVLTAGGRPIASSTAACDAARSL
jgi:hypothetical protein